MSVLPADPQQRQKVLLAVLLVALLGYVAHQYLYHPRAAEAVGLEARLANLQAFNRGARALLHGADPGLLEEEVGLYYDQLAVVEALIPAAAEVPDLLDAISLQAERLGVEIALIRPTGSVEEEFYMRRTYDLVVLGSYHQIAEFLTRIASLPRILTPVNLSLAPRTEGSRGGDTRLEAAFSIETHVLPPTGPAAENPDAE